MRSPLAEASHVRVSLLCLIALFTALFVFAEDVVLTDGTTYHDVAVTSLRSNEMEITHSAGAKRVRFADLPPETKAKYEQAWRESTNAQVHVTNKVVAGSNAVNDAGWSNGPATPPFRPYYTHAQLEEAKYWARKEHKAIAWLAGDADYWVKIDPHKESSHSAFWDYGSSFQNESILVYSRYLDYEFHQVPWLNTFIHQQTGGPIMTPFVAFADEEFTNLLYYLPYIRSPGQRTAKIQEVIRMLSARRRALLAASAPATNLGTNASTLTPNH